MQRVDAPEILDTDACLPAEVQSALAVISRINRLFGGVSTTQKMVEGVAQATALKCFSLLEVAAARGEVPEIVRKNLSQLGIQLDVTLLDMSRSHLSAENRSVVADALHLPFADRSFDLVSCCLFTHHLDSRQLKQFLQEALRVCRKAVLINDLVRHPVHLALVYASYPIMRNRVAWLDGLTSVRRAYTPGEMRESILSTVSGNEIPQIEISRHYLYRMGVTVWKTSAEDRTA